jgi:O-antigen/teichoic acid export membrane protein
MQGLAGFLNGHGFSIIAAFALQVTGVGLSFLFSILLARTIGVGGVGFYFLAVTIVDIGATLSRLGLENTALRFASVAYYGGDRLTLAALHRKSIGLAFGAGIAITLLLWLIVSYAPVGSNLTPQLRADFLVLLLGLAPMAVLVVQAEFLKGIGATTSGTFTHAVLPPLLLLFGTIILWPFDAITLHSVFLTYLLAVTIAVVYGLAVWTVRLPGIWQTEGAFDTRRLFRTSIPVLMVTSMNLVMGWTDILVLGIWGENSEVGIYGICMRIALLSTVVLAAINVVIAPRFAALHAAGSVDALRRLAQHSAFWTLAVAAPGVLFLLLAPDLILWLFGPQFQQGITVLRILALGQLVNVATGPVGTLLLMTGHEKMIRNIIAVSATLNLLGNLSLVPFWGAVGAAASTAFSLAFMNVLSLIIVRKKLSINILDYRL